MRNYLIGSVVINFLYIFFTTVLINSGLGMAILAFFEKNLTLSSRLTIILPATLEQIQEELLLGHGVLSSDRRVRMYGGFKAAIHAHNQFLEILFIGGIVLLAAYLVFLWILSRRLMKRRDVCASRVLSTCVLALLVMTIVEVFTRGIAAGIWCMLILCYYCGNLDKQFRRRKDYRDTARINFMGYVKRRRKWRLN